MTDTTTPPAPVQTIHQLLTSVLSGVLANTWLKELPPRPTWPAAVFDVDSAPEGTWCQGAGYYEHDVQILVLSRSAAQLDALLPTSGGGAFRAALEPLLQYCFEQGCDDAQYEADAQVYCRVLELRMRTRS